MFPCGFPLDGCQPAVSAPLALKTIQPSGPELKVDERVSGAVACAADAVPTMTRATSAAATVPDRRRDPVLQSAPISPGRVAWKRARGKRRVRSRARTLA